MLILTIRTDRPDAEIGLYKNETKLAYVTWQAHRQLSVTIHKKIEALLKSRQKNWNDIEAIIVFKGPGSFTGLRIGVSVANALSLSLQKPCVSFNGEDWIKRGIKQLKQTSKRLVIVPEYGRPVHITQPKK